MRIELQPAYVLHTRPYRDTSMLVDLFTPEQGRVAVIAKGVRQSKSRRRALLNPFNPLLVSFQGRSGLKLLTGVESDGHSVRLQGAALYCGFYLNELLLRLLAEQDAHLHLHQNYRLTLEALSVDPDLEPLLRRFEFSLLEELGYGIDFDAVAGTGAPPSEQDWYGFDPDRGFVPQESRPDGDASSAPFSGLALRALGADDYSHPDTRVVAKRLTRLALRPLLGSKPLHSRELFREFPGHSASIHQKD